MLTDNEIKETVLKLIDQKKQLKEKLKEQEKISLELKSIKGKINWNQSKLIEHLEETNLKRIVLEKYSFLAKTNPVPSIKILESPDKFPDEYKYFSKVNKALILKTYHRDEMEKLEGLVEITQKKYIAIEERKDATVTYSKPNKKIKRLSDESNQ
jgi:hypothetical protein